MKTSAFLSALYIAGACVYAGAPAGGIQDAFARPDAPAVTARRIESAGQGKAAGDSEKARARAEEHEKQVDKNRQLERAIDAGRRETERR